MAYVIDNFIVICGSLGFLTSCWVWLRFIYYRRLVNKIDYTMRAYRDIKAGGNTDYSWAIELLAQIDRHISGEDG